MDPWRRPADAGTGLIVLFLRFVSCVFSFSLETVDSITVRRNLVRIVNVRAIARKKLGLVALLFGLIDRVLDSILK